MLAFVFWALPLLLWCAGSRVIIMAEANSSVRSKVLKLLPKLKTEELERENDEKYYNKIYNFLLM